MRVFTITVLLVLLASCASTKQYEGPTRPPEEIAILENTTMTGPVVINQINGNFRGVGIVKQFEFVPGTITLMVTYNPADKPNPGKIDLECDTSYVPVSFSAEAGRRYKIGYELEQAQWKVWVLDVESKKIVSDKVVGKVKTKSGKFLMDISSFR